jgi:hypothetical protein
MKIIILVCGIAVIASGGSLKGVVVNEDGFPIAGALLEISQTMDCAKSSRTGAFALEISDKSSVMPLISEKQPPSSVSDKRYGVQKVKNMVTAGGRSCPARAGGMLAAAVYVTEKQKHVAKGTRFREKKRIPALTAGDQIFRSMGKVRNMAKKDGKLRLIARAKGYTEAAFEFPPHSGISDLGGLVLRPIAQTDKPVDKGKIAACLWKHMEAMGIDDSVEAWVEFYSILLDSIEPKPSPVVTEAIDVQAYERGIDSIAAIIGRQADVQKYDSLMATVTLSKAELYALRSCSFIVSLARKLDPPRPPIFHNSM